MSVSHVVSTDSVLSLLLRVCQCKNMPHVVSTDSVLLSLNIGWCENVFHVVSTDSALLLSFVDVRTCPMLMLYCC